jgi:hypothetical protein
MSGMSSDQIKKDNCKLIVRCLNVPVGGRRPSLLQSIASVAKKVSESQRQQMVGVSSFFLKGTSRDLS